MGRTNRKALFPAGEDYLLHACCGPCASASAERLLEEGHGVTLFYSNHNIAPEAEWDRRLEGLRRVAEELSLPLVVDPPDHQDWLRTVRGYEKEPEGGARCALCFRYSLSRTAEQLRRSGPEGQAFDSFATTLTISPHKNFDLISEIGRTWPEFRPWNFKKKDGYRRSLALSREWGLYRQNYCGCEFSRFGGRVDGK